MKHNTIEGMIRLAFDVARMSKDPNRQVGAIIVTQDGSPISWGYNGFARGIKDDVRLYDNDLKLSMIVHAEANAVYNAARAGASTFDAIMISTLFPCVHCANAIIQAGVSELICPDPKITETQSKWFSAMSQSKELLLEAGVKLTLKR
jgi:dCMP deaminase